MRVPTTEEVAKYWKPIHRVLALSLAGSLVPLLTNEAIEQYIY